MTPTQSRSPVEILRATRELIATKPKWTQRASARDRADNGVDYDDPTAVCFCIFGAVKRTLRPGESFSVVWGFLRRATRRLPIMVNDLEDHTAVLAMVDRAVSLSLAEQSEKEAVVQ